jgi:anti-sigma B factor antagonist
MTETTIGVETRDGVAVLRVQGDVTAASEAAFGDAYTQAVDAGARTAILDFSGLEYMNSGGIGLLVTLLVRSMSGGQQLFATGLNEHYRQILSLTRLDEAIRIYDTEAAALAAAGQGVRT